MPSHRAAVLVATWIVAAQLPASAQTRAALSWVRAASAEDCVGAPELGQRVENIIGPVLVSAADAEVSIEGHIERSHGRFQAEIRVSDAQGRVTGSRQLQERAADCRLLDEQLAFVIAIMLDPDRSLAELPGEFSSDHELEPELSAQQSTATTRLSQPPPKRAGRTEGPAWVARSQRQAPFRFRVAAGPAAGLAVLRTANAGAQAEVGVVFRAWSHHIQGAVWLPRTHHLGGGASVDTSLLQLGVATCPLLWRNVLEVAGCGGLAAARLSATPHGFVEGKPRASWAWGPTLEARLGWPMTPSISLSLRVGAHLRWSQARVVYGTPEGEREVYRLPRAVGQTAFAFELQF